MLVYWELVEITGSLLEEGEIHLAHVKCVSVSLEIIDILWAIRIPDIVVHIASIGCGSQAIGTARSAYTGVSRVHQPSNSKWVRVGAVVC